LAYITSTKIKRAVCETYHLDLLLRNFESAIDRTKVDDASKKNDFDRTIRTDLAKASMKQLNQ